MWSRPSPCQWTRRSAVARTSCSPRTWRSIPRNRCTTYSARPPRKWLVCFPARHLAIARPRPPCNHIAEIFMTTKVDRRIWLTRAAHASLAIATGMLGARIVNTTHAAEKPMKLGKDATPRQVAESYWRAECAHDIEAVGQHYHPDAVFMPPGERLAGWPNIRKWYEEAFRLFPGVEVDIVHEVRQ